MKPLRGRAWPTNEELRRRGREWDKAQNNDLALLNADPAKAEALKAAALLETNPALGFPRLVDLAQSGSAWSMLKVAGCFADGVGGVVQNLQEAVNWNQRAYEAGSLRGLLAYGSVLEYRGELEAAERVFEAAAAKNWAPALFHLAQIRLKRSRTRLTYLAVLPLLQSAAAQGSILARWALARDMARGRYGLRHVLRGFQMMKAFSDEMLAELRPESGGRSPSPSAETN